MEDILHYVTLNHNLIKPIKHIYHIADIHIRQYKRHEEYLSVFENLYQELDKQGNLDESLLVMVGDILHSKNELTPELIDMIYNWFTNLSNKLPVVVIAGNHDANLANKNRMDSLSPITNMITQTQYPFYYLKNSGIYTLQNLVLVVNSVFDDKFILANQIDKTYLKNKTSICLWHGTVDQVTLWTGTKLENEYIKVSSFDGYDITMLGDIHKQQSLNEKGNIAYSGSLIQQNFGESLFQHGMLKWNVKSKKYKLIEIRNEYGYANLKLTDNDSILIDDSISHTGRGKNSMPKYPRLRIKVSNKVDKPKEIELLGEIKKKYTPIDMIVERYEDNELNNLKTNMELSLIDITKLEYQQNIIKQYLVNKNYPSNTIQQIIDINTQIFQNTTFLEFNDDWSWDLISLDFSNMFCYGENNRINFSKFNGIIGIVAPNHYGKSSIIDILLFGLYDKMSRGKRIDIINKNKTSCKCSIEIKIGDEYYRIDRNGTNGKQGLKVNVKFNKIVYKENGKKEIISLTGEQRRETQKMIESYIGTYENSISSIISLQNKEMGIIDMKQTDRKQYLSNILKLDILDQQHTLANQKYKEIDIEHKLISKELGETSETPKELQQQINMLEDTINNLEITIQEHNNEKWILTQQYENKIAGYKEIGEINYPDFSKDKLQYEIFNSKVKKSDLQFKNENKEKYNSYLVDKIDELQQQIQQIKPDKSKLEEQIDQLNDILESKYATLYHISGDFTLEKNIELEKKINKKKKLLLDKDQKIENITHMNKQLIKTILIDDDSYSEQMELNTTKQDAINIKLKNIYQQMIVVDKDVGIIDTSQQIDTINQSLTKLTNMINDKLDRLMEDIPYNKRMDNITTIKEKIDNYQNNYLQLVKLKVIENDNKKITNNIKLEEKKIKYEDKLELVKIEENNIKTKYKKTLHIRDQINNNINDSNNNQLDKKEIENGIDKYQQLLFQWEKNNENYNKNIVIEKEIKKIKIEKKELKQQLILLNTNHNELVNEIKEYELEIQQMEKEKKTNEQQILEFMEYISKLQDDIIHIDIYNKNKGIKIELDEIKNKITNLQTIIESITSKVNNSKIELGITHNKLNKIVIKRDILQQLDRQKKNYKIYLDMMGTKEGIQNELISKSLPIIENKVNTILTSITDYTLEMKMVDNHIDINLVYPNKIPHSIELACGYEKFISSIAIRIGLLNISRKNKPTFISIDEGWSNLDMDNLNNIDKLLYHLKTQFKIVLVISHIDSIKGELDTILQIEKTNQDSYIHY